MKFPSFMRLFGKRWPGKSSRRSSRKPARRASLHLESLETRELLAAAPFIVPGAATPPDGSLSPDPQPTLSVTFSEDMVNSEVRNPANYLLFDSSGTRIPVDGVTYDNVNHTAFLLYNGGQALPADRFSLFVRGDRIHDVNDGLPLTPPGQLVVANGAEGAFFNQQSGVSQVNAPLDSTLHAIQNYAPTLQTSSIFQAAPQDVALGDINNDGVTDMVTVNSIAFTTATVEIFDGIAAPTGGFINTPRVVPLPNVASQQPSAVVLADMNRDGFRDIIVGSSDSASVAVILNNGQGQFLGGTDFLMGSNLTDVVVADFNNDLRPDIATTHNLGQNNLVIRLAQANGQFGVPVTFTASSTGLAALAAADLDGDSRIDIAVASGAGVQIMLNATSTGGTAASFVASPTILAQSVGFSSIAIGNLDADPRPDIAATPVFPSSFNNTVAVFQNTGTGNFGQASFVAANPNPTVFARVGGVTIADVDGDRLNDILVVNDNGFFQVDSTMAVIRNSNQGGTFLPPVGYAVDSQPTDLAVATDAQGKVTLAAASSAQARDTSTLRNRGDGVFLVSRDMLIPNLNLPSSIFSTFGFGNPIGRLVASGDVNGDFIPDVVVANPNRNNVTVLLATPNGPNPYAAPSVYGVGAQPVSVTLADLTGTGVLDIIVANQGEDTVHVLANSGTGTFVTSVIVPVGRTPTEVVAGDFNNDGRLDLAVSHNGQFTNQQSDRGVSVLVGRGDRTFNLKTEVAVGLQAASLVTADFNADGSLDIAAIEHLAAGNVVLLLGDPQINVPSSTVATFSRRTTFAAGEFPSSVAVGDLNRDGLPDIVVTNQSTFGFNQVQTNYISVLLNTPGTRFLPPIRTNVFPNTNTRLHSIAVTDINEDFFPDVVASADSPSFATQNQMANNLVALQGLGNGTFLDPQFYSTNGGGNPQISSNNIPPSYMDVVSNPLVLVTSFRTRGTSVSSNLVRNGNFDVLDLNGEKGNLTGWQMQKQRDSHGGWSPQSGILSPLSGVLVASPVGGQYAAMLDQPDVELPYESGIGGAIGSPLLFGNRRAPRQQSDYDGAHFLYQDVFIPDTATRVTLSLHLYINNSDPINPVGYATTPQLDYFPGIPAAVRPQNQQVRVDVMNPTSPINDTGAGVLLNVFRTNSSTPRIFGYDANPNLPGPNRLTADVTAFRGRTIRLRVAAVNNLGKLIVGVDNVQINAEFTDTQAPSINDLHMRNPGFRDTNITDPLFGGSTTDPTIVGRAGDEGSPENLDFIAVDVDNDGDFFTPGRDYTITTFDAEGNFSTTLPTDLPGLYTVGLRVFDKGGNSTDHRISFTFQGPSLDTWQAAGPGPLRFVASNIAYSSVSGRITSVELDPRDPSGNVFYVGSDNGGVWKTIDGGNNWTPLTDFLSGPAGGAVSVNIGAIAVDPNNPDIVYAGTGVADTYETSHPGFGILKSTNAGQSWELIAQQVFNGARITRIEVSKRRTRDGVITVYVAVASGGQFGPGVYASDDFGNTWRNIFNLNNMFTETGAPLPAGSALASVTDFRIDRLSFDEENIWVGVGNIGLVPTANTGGVWKSPNHGQQWFRQGGLTGGVENRGLPPLNPYGTNIGRVTLALATGRFTEQGTVYALIVNPRIPGDAATELHDIFNPGGATQGRFATGLYKTDNGGLDWTKVMLRENVFPRAGQNQHDYVDILLTGTINQEASAVGALVVDPNDANVVYVGGSTRYNSEYVPLHGLIRVDTRNMIRGRDTVVCNTAIFSVDFDPLRGMGDDYYKKCDAVDLQNNTTILPGRYQNNDGYEGEGVFWYDLQQDSTNSTSFFNQLKLPATIHALQIDPQGRLLVGTIAGIWRGVSQGFTYDTTSGGPQNTFFIGPLPPGSVTYSIESDFGVPTPRQGGMVFTNLNSNLQIANQTSVAIDPVDRQRLHSSQANLGWAQTSGPLPTSLGWTYSGDLTVSTVLIGAPPNAGTLRFIFHRFDPLVDLAQYAGVVRTAPLDEQPAAAGPPFSTVYRTYLNQGFAGQLPYGQESFFRDVQIQASNINGDQGTFNPIVRGLEIFGSPLAVSPPLAVNTTQIVDEKGFFVDQLLFGTDRIQRSDNSGVLWDTISAQLAGAPVTALAISPQAGPNGQHGFYAGMQNGQVYIDLQNGGQGFPNRSTGLPTGQRINGLAVDPTDINIAYAAVDGFNTGTGHIFFTNNGGGNWVNLTGNLPDVPVYAVAVDRRPIGISSQGRLFVGTEVGAFVSTDWLNGTATWVPLGKGLPNVPVRDIQFDPITERLVVATQGRGTFVLSTDLFGPRVADFSPSSPTVAGIDFVSLVFDEPIDPRTFTVDQIRTLVGPNGPIPVLAIEDVPDPLTSQIDHRHFRIRFPVQPADGEYTLVVGPNLRDFVGNAMDHNGNRINGEDPTDRFTLQFVLNGTDNGRFVAGLYRDVLGVERAPDADGFQFFLGTIDEARTRALNTVSLLFTSSDEARGNFIAGLYSTSDPGGQRTPLFPLGNLLNRPASQFDKNFWVALMKNGVTPAQVLSMIVGSPEYFEANGGNDAGFVGQIYQHLLGRPADAAGQNDFQRILAQAEEAARRQVSNLVTSSLEYRNNLVVGHFFGLLGRAPTTEELIFWVSTLVQGGTDEQVMAGLIGSDEYYRNHGGTDLGWINGAFQDILFRGPDAAGTNAVLTQLAGGVDRPTIALQLLSTDEYRTRLVSGYFGRFLSRAVSADEVTFFVNLMRFGARDEDVLSLIVSSQGYFQDQFRGPTGIATRLVEQNNNWIRALYIDVLGRGANDAEVATFLNTVLLPAEALARTQVAQLFTNSPEYVSRLVRIVYTGYLGREPSTGEINLWLPLLRQGSGGPGTIHPEEQFLAAVLASREYLNRQREPDRFNPSTTIASNTEWSESLYTNLLKRGTNPAEVDGIANLVLSRYTTERLTTARLMVQSDEYRTKAVENYYRTYLRRAPRANETAFHVGRLQAGDTHEQVIARIIASDEYFQNPTLGIGDNSRWLSQVYLDLLGRERDPFSQPFLDLLNATPAAQQALVRETIVLQILGSTEYLNRFIGGPGVGLYARFLRRLPSAGEVNFWVTQIQFGVRTDDVLAQLLASHEYFQRPHMFP